VFAAALDADAIANVRATMRMHFADLKAGKGRGREAFDSPSLGFACWMAEFTAFRERLRQKKSNGNGLALPGYARVEPLPGEDEFFAERERRAAQMRTERKAVPK
jgi:hypothetical protein